MKKRTIKFYTHLLAPIGEEGVTRKHWKALWIIQQVSMSVARMFGGKFYSDDTGTVQVNDIVVFDDISEDKVQFILASHPYAREIKRY